MTHISKEKPKPDEDFIVKIDKLDEDTTLITSTNEKKVNDWLEQNFAQYDPSNRQYSAYLNFSAGSNTLTQDLINTLGQNPQTSLESIQQINAIIRQQINVDDVIGMVVQSIENNINTDFRLSYKNFGEARNKSSTLKKAKALIDDFNNQVDIKKIIRDSIITPYTDGTYISVLRNNNTNWYVDYYPLGVAEISGYSVNGNPVVIVNVDELKTVLSKTMLKTKKNKALFFEDVGKEIQSSYPKEVYDAYIAKEKYAKLDVDYTGVVRVNNRSRKYGLSPIFRTLSSLIMLQNFQSADTASAKSKAKKIIHQVMREKCLGSEGNRKAIKEMTFCHGEFMKAFQNNTVVYTSAPEIEKIVYVEPKTQDIDVEKVQLYRNKVLSSLGIAFLATDKNQTAGVSQISLQQLLQCINSISEQSERMIENFYKTVLTVNNIGLEYVPSISIIDSEMLDAKLKFDLAKLLYTTFNCSRDTTLGLVGINLQDETLKRKQENEDGLGDIFEPYGTSLTKSGDDTPAGRPADPKSTDPDKQIEDKVRKDVTK